MPNLDLVFRIGETKRIAYEAVADEDGTTFTVSSVTAYIYNSAGTAVVNGSAGGVDSASAAATHEIYYLWSPDTAGRYTYQLRYVVGSQTLAVQGEVTVLSATSKYDVWVRRIIDWMQISQAGDALQALSDAQLRDCALEAVRVYSSYKPRRVLLDAQALTANDWDYSLSLWTSWEKRFSMADYLEIIDDTLQSRRLLTVSTDMRSTADVLVDEVRGVWQFRTYVPSTGGTYRLVYTCRHTLSDATDTVTSEEPADFDSVCQWAAGEALEQLANLAAGTEGRGGTEAVVNYRTKAQEYGAQGKRMKAQAAAKWRPAYVVM